MDNRSQSHLTIAMFHAHRADTIETKSKFPNPMKSKSTSLALFSLLAVLAGATPSFAAESTGATLKMGDPAPKLQTGKWVQGEPVKEFARGTVYIVEFWATWCGPCKVSIPHLNELHQQFKDKGVVVIGQDCWERDDALVEPFVKKMGDQMSYRVAMDDKSDGGRGAMAANWMTAAGQNGIPAAFVVDKQGKIAWIGHPMKLTAAMLEEIIAGKFDLEKAAKEQSEERARQQASQTINRELTSLQSEFTRQLSDKKWEDAEATCAKMEKLAQDLPASAHARLSLLRLQLLLAREDMDGAVKFARETVEANPSDPPIRLSIASRLASIPDVKGPALELAAKLAEEGYSAGGDRGDVFAMVLARIKMLQGDKDKAVELQAKALNSLPASAPESLRKRYQATLDGYKEGKLPATPTPR